MTFTLTGHLNLNVFQGISFTLMRHLNLNMLTPAENLNDPNGACKIEYVDSSGAFYCFQQGI